MSNLAIHRVATTIILAGILGLIGCGDNAPVAEKQIEMRGADSGNTGFGDITFGDGTIVDSGATPDTGTPDTGAPDTGTPDTGTPDTGTPDTGTPDTGTPDTGAPDTGTPDSGAPDAGDPDAGTPDSGATDAGGNDAGSPSDASAGDASSGDGGGGGDATGGPNSCVGRCGKYDGSATCQCDEYCKSYGDCCADIDKVCGCVGDDCCTKDTDCDDKLACTADSCGPKGTCEHKPQKGFCAIEGVCVKAGGTGTTPKTSCAICDPAKTATAWSAQPKGAKCDDGVACTANDICDDKGVCAGTPKAGCCATAKDCTGGSACQTASCNAGTCAYADKPGCCASGVCCDVANQSLQPKGAACGAKTVATEYQCNGAQVQKRDAVAGCDGSSATTCSAANPSWSGWSTIASCAAGQTCTPQAGGKVPVCIGAGGGCTKPADCDDGNPCTTDTCVGGKCQSQGKAGCCVFASDCDDGNLCTTETCSGNTCKSSAKTCTAPSACETAACDAKSGACVSQVAAGSCRIDGACLKSGAKHPTDGCLVCDPSKSQTAWSLTGVCSCKDGVCCDVKKGRIKAKASTCDDKVQATEYSCAKDGGAVLVRTATRGCTGKSNTCSVSKSNWHWSDWSAQKTCAKGTVCEVGDKDKPGVCVKGGGGTPTCNPSATNACCTNKGTVAPKSTPCDTPVVKSELKCSTSAPGGVLQERHAVAGCTGLSDTCSSADAYLAWGDWKTKKQCGKSEVCGVSADGKTGGCTPANACDPKLSCCTAAGAPAAKGTACGAVKTEYRCAKSGAAVEKRTGQGTCTGSAATCDAKAITWGSWATTTSCKSGTVCTVGEDGSPGCTKDPGVSCGKSDKWEGPAKTADSKSVGSFNDGSPALILSPKVHLGSSTDKDYLTYKLADTSALHEPRAHVEWDAPGAVFVCAYARCTKASDGKSCAKVVCPAGSTPYKNSVVSGVSVNGCCTKVAKGTIDFAIDTPGKTDDSAEVYFNVKNEAPFCQEVSVKLGFGKAVATQCDPKAACCTAQGLYSSKGTKCGTKPLATEYRCTNSQAGGDVESRSSYASCTGSSASCGTTAPIWEGWKLATACSNNQLCVVSDKTKPGSCVSANDALCKATDKWEGPTKTAESVNLGSFKEDANAVLLSPMVHLGKGDADWFKYRIVDDPNLLDPVLHISWTAASTVTVCAYYQCLAGPNGSDCYPVTCPSGSQTYVNTAVSDVKPNGCCMTAKQGELEWEPDAPGIFNTDETGWVYFNVKNAAPICQRANIKLRFEGSTKVCGDGKCEAGESTSCPNDCGTCANACGAKYDNTKACQCDDQCEGIGDCCWDKPLLCGP